MLSVEMMLIPLQVTNNVLGKSYADKTCMIDDKEGGDYNNGYEQTDKKIRKVIRIMEYKIPQKIQHKASNFVDCRDLFFQIACSEGDAKKGSRKCWIMAGITLFFIALTVSVCLAFHFGKIKGKI